MTFPLISRRRHEAALRAERAHQLEAHDAWTEAVNEVARLRAQLHEARLELMDAQIERDRLRRLHDVVAVDGAQGAVVRGDLGRDDHM